jgi:hypothetical protein
MDTKRILKNIAFIVFVPSVVVGGYYGYKFIKKKYDDKKALTEKQNIYDGRVYNHFPRTNVYANGYF